MFISAFWLTRCPKLAPLLFPPVAPPGHLPFLHSVSTSPSLRKQTSSKVSIPWSSTIALAVHALHSRSSKTCLMLACIVQSSLAWSQLLLLERNERIMKFSSVFNTNLGFHVLPKFGPKLWFCVAFQYLILSEGI